MPDATILYLVTAVVVAALVVWVALVLKTAKEPWQRASVLAASASVDDEVAASVVGEAGSALNADETARATPLALASDSKAKSAAQASE